MKLSCLKKTVVLAPCLLLFAAVPLMIAAQDDGTDGPPKVLYVVREMTKPGKGGVLHEKTESAFVNTLTAAKAPMHYLALTSITGPDRALFLSGYPNFAAMEEEHKAMGKIPGLEAKLDSAGVADGDLLASTDESTWVRRDDQSYNSGNLMGARLMEISKYVVKPGHMKEWDELVKMVLDGYKKGVPSSKWTMFEEAYGSDGASFLVIVPLKSMEEIDHHFAHDKDFMDAVGKDGMKKLDELEASCVESEMTNLFAISPKMSAPPDSWVKAEPDYWKPKPAPVKKPEAKPAQ